jgi:hypothetical protein
MRELIGMFFGIVLVGGVLNLLVKALLLLWGAQIMNIQGRSFGKALAVGVLSSALAYGSSLLLGIPLHSYKVFAVGLLLAAWLGAMFFKCDFMQALGAATLAWVLSWILGLALGAMGLALFFI